MGFIFLGFAIFAFLEFTNAGYSGVEIFMGEIFANIRSESVYYNSIQELQRCKLAGFVVEFISRCHSIEWRAASEGFTSTRRYGCLSLEKGLVALAKEATK